MDTERRELLFIVEQNQPDGHWWIRWNFVEGRRRLGGGSQRLARTSDMTSEDGDHILTEISAAIGTWLF